MALNNLAALKASALAWIERVGDPAAETIVSDCVTLCEARVNKVPNLRLSTMETDATLTPGPGGIEATLPSDFLAMKRVATTVGEGRLLSYAEPSWLRQAYPPVVDDDCNFYTIVGTDIRARSSGPLNIIYYAKVPALATTDPNWLLSKAPDVYLYGTILELLNALEGNGVEKYAGMFGAAVEGLIQSETFSRGGVLTMRSSMPAP